MKQKMFERVEESIENFGLDFSPTQQMYLHSVKVQTLDNCNRKNVSNQNNDQQEREETIENRETETAKKKWQTLTSKKQKFGNKKAYPTKVFGKR